MLLVTRFAQNEPIDRNNRVGGQNDCIWVSLNAIVGLPVGNRQGVFARIFTHLRRSLDRYSRVD
jgi:hypothetical protein